VLLERLCLLWISAPTDVVGTPLNADFVSPPGAYGRLDSSCLGAGAIDEEIMSSWLQESTGSD